MKTCEQARLYIVGLVGVAIETSVLEIELNESNKQKMSTAKERMLLLIPSTVVETLLVVATRITLERPSIVFLYALAVNFVLLSIWSVFIWPFFINPLRHLPTVHV